MNSIVSESIYAIMRPFVRARIQLQKEYFWSIGLTMANDITYIELVTIGILNRASVDPVELFSFAVQKKCKRIILVHNHPSGETKPSVADKKLTQFLQEGGRYLNIKIEDHLIISETGYFSFAGGGLL